MTEQQLLSQFQAQGLESCFHDRHISPQILAGLNGNNWQLKDYEARGGTKLCGKFWAKMAQKA
jgi:NADH-quinone oxidoreductase subunit F